MERINYAVFLDIQKAWNISFMVEKFGDRIELGKGQGAKIYDISFY